MGYSQDLRVFVIGCPSITPIAQKLLAKISKAADKIDELDEEIKQLQAENKRLKKAVEIAREYISAEGDCVEQSVRKEIEQVLKEKPE